jgi:integrase
LLQEQRRWLLEIQHPALPLGLIWPASPRQARAGAARRNSDELMWYRSPSVLDRPLRLACERAGLPRVSLHALRRTFENLLRSAGVDQLVRRSLAGWRTESAQAIYAQVSPEERLQAVQKMAQLVAEGVRGGCRTDDA